jgi:type IV pilus assembly protein PilA
MAWISGVVWALQVGVNRLVGRLRQVVPALVVPWQVAPGSRVVSKVAQLMTVMGGPSHGGPVDPQALSGVNAMPDPASAQRRTCPPMTRNTSWSIEEAFPAVDGCTAGWVARRRPYLQLCAQEPPMNSAAEIAFGPVSGLVGGPMVEVRNPPRNGLGEGRRMQVGPREERRDQGFTLIELLVALVIVGVLASVAIPVFLNQRAKSVDASLKADLVSLARAQESWAVSNPSALSGTDNAAALAAEGFKASPGNTVWVSLNGPRQGYCLLAWSPGSTVGIAGGTGNNVMAYDSRSGGIQTGYLFYTRSDGNPNSLTLLPGACGPGRTTIAVVS